MNSLFDNLIDNLVEQVSPICEQLKALPLADQVEALNRIRHALHEVGPFRGEPVDLVLWVPSAEVAPNDYNPNTVHRPEMRLLETSIDLDGFTQPVVTHRNHDVHRIVDGEHRFIVGTTHARISRRLHGYLPVAVAGQDSEEERMASTVRHNRARGVHHLGGMTDIVKAMEQAGWPDDRIARALGMDADEILRLKQVGGVAATYYNKRDYNRAWITDDGQDEL
jgi:ParB-like chromosome segregation protein Spo0J